MNLVYLKQCDSTQDYLKNQIEKASAFDCVFSDAQSKGRGRRGRTWIDSEGSLAFSIVLKLCEEKTLTSLKVGVLVNEFLNLRKVPSGLKWPNDIIDDDFNKIGGILIETIENDFCIAGIGLNVNNKPQEAFDYGVSSIVEISSRSINVQEYAKELHQYFIYHYDSIHESETPERWSRQCFHLNKNISFCEQDKKIQGIFDGVGSRGEAIIDGKHFFNGSVRLP